LCNTKENRKDIEKTMHIWKYKNELTSTRATNEAVIIAKASPASNVGAPH